ncbi:Na+-transporting NADH:ubiquinone oxidoreductase subunit A [Litoreibacter janthinus]|uniref:Na+-transporting NADH:ubiquinone oxidoreductase subunit A n=1 Tax=Litoreibacter janthinus TaxID=670154 RepID=A0A1I6FSE2_9RHOB|nr:Na+-transporting NADH:ubiquinone oxidoreductase subunit A [Litoreibacter janthinus]
MRILRFGSGLNPSFPSPPLRDLKPVEIITQEAAIRASSGQTLRIDTLVRENDDVPQGAPVACLRDAPDVKFVAPMAGRIARIKLQPGRKLTEIVIFREEGEVVRHDISNAAEKMGLRRLMQNSGIWPLLRRRPFGGMPTPDETPAAILVMALDTRPYAPDPRQALQGREAAFERGLLALSLLCDGEIFVCQASGPTLLQRASGRGKIRAVECTDRHPHGSAGLCSHGLAPATIETPVWDIHAEDVAALGDLVMTGILPMKQLVQIDGEGLKESRLVRTQPGADLRELTLRAAAHGAHALMSGSPLDGHEAHWLAPRHRQVTVLPRGSNSASPHWFTAALTRSSLPKPVIPTAALRQAFGVALPAVALVRALSSGDDELAMKLGALSLLEEDLGLADYVLGGEAHLAVLLRRMLDRVQTEFAP